MCAASLAAALGGLRPRGARAQSSASNAIGAGNIGTNALSNLAADRWFTSSDGVALHYLEAGVAPRANPPRPTLVFIPGWSMPAWIWAAQLAHFAPAWRVLVLDPRGQGLSAIAPTGYTYQRRAADIAELLQAAQVDSVVLLGWSLGVLECLQALADGAQPDLRPRLRALVLVDNSIGEGPPPAPAPPSTPRRPSFFQRLRTQRQDTMATFVRTMFKQPQPAAWLADLTEAALRLPLQDSIALLNQRTPRDFWRNTLYALTVPVLYVSTPRLAQQGRLAQARGGSIEAVVFDDAGHALFVDEAPRFNALLEGFLARLPGAAMAAPAAAASGVAR